MDKPQNDNIGLFMLDLFCTFAAVGLIGFCIYIAPYVFTGEQYYDVPAFVIHMHNWYINEKELAGVGLMFAMFVPFLLGAGCFFTLAKMISGYIQRLDHKAKQRAKKKNEREMDEREGMVAATRVSVIMFLLIIFVIMVLLFVEFLFSSSL